MSSTVRNTAAAVIVLFVGNVASVAATVRGQLLCEEGHAPATGVAVTAYTPQIGRTAASFTGGDGMYYLTIPAGQYTLEVWLSKQSNAPTNTYPIYVNEPMTDIARIFVPVCYPQ